MALLNYLSYRFGLELGWIPNALLLSLSVLCLVFIRWPLKQVKFKVQLVQTVAILREGDAGVPVAEILRKHDISSATYHNWKAGLAMRQI